MASTRPPRRTGRGRRFWERAIWVAIAGLVCRTWYVEGLLVPFEVTSGSMAPTLLGPHRDLTCPDCGCQFACGTDLPAPQDKAVCPYCGRAGIDLASQPAVAGDRLLIHKGVFRIRPPQRWEVVAFRHPEHPSLTCVKRVVGLPGEAIWLRNGQVWADGRIQRKPLVQQRAMAVLVYDADHPPKADLAAPPRWTKGREGSLWGSTDGRLAHPSTPDNGEIDWLTYRHWRRLPGPTPVFQEGPITNQCGYNQPPIERWEYLVPVPDVMLSFRLVRSRGPGTLWVKATDGSDQFLVRLDPARRLYEAFRGEEPAKPFARGPLPAEPGELWVEVSLFDAQFLLALNGRSVAAVPYEPAQPPPPTSAPLAIGSQGLEVELHELRVYRDVYYTRPVGQVSRWGCDRPFSLGAGEYFVLGDNSAISGDSRTFPSGPGVQSNLIIGKPWLVHLPVKYLSLGGRDFQVPDPARMRYIR